MRMSGIRGEISKALNEPYETYRSHFSHSYLHTTGPKPQRVRGVGCSLCHHRNWSSTAPLNQNIALKEKMAGIHFPALEATKPRSDV